jgi:hypothetical protein
MTNRFVLCLSAIVFLAGVGATWLSTAIAETVAVKYRGPVDLSPFACEWITRSAVVERLCYDTRERYVIVNLRGIYYHYCEVPPNVVAAWQQADSMGKFHNEQVKGRFDCRVLRVPSYAK